MTRVCRVAALLVALSVVAVAPAACGHSGQPAAQSATTPAPGVSGSSPSGASPTPGPSRTPSATPAPRPSPTRSRPPFPPSLAGEDAERIPTDRAVVALTFDAGANADGLPAIAEGADLLTNVEGAIFTIDTCADKGWTSRACMDSAAQTALGFGANVAVPGLPAGTVLDVATGGNSLVSDIGDALGNIDIDINLW
jgi:hypothetical protein